MARKKKKDRVKLNRMTRKLVSDGIKREPYPITRGPMSPYVRPGTYRGFRSSVVPIVFEEDVQ